MTKAPSLIPHQVIADWIQSNDDHVLKDAPKPVVTAFDGTNFDTFDYSFVSRQARKAQAEAISAVFGSIGRKAKWVLAPRSRRSRTSSSSISGRRGNDDAP